MSSMLQLGIRRAAAASALSVSASASAARRAAVPLAAAATRLPLAITRPQQLRHSHLLARPTPTLTPVNRQQVVPLPPPRLLSPSAHQHLRSISFWARIGPLRRLPVLLGGGAASAYGYVQYKVAGTQYMLLSAPTFANGSGSSSSDAHATAAGEALAWAILALAASTTAWVDQHVDLAKSTFFDVLDTVSANLTPLQDNLRTRLDLIQGQLNQGMATAREAMNSARSSTNSSSGSSSSSSSGGPDAPNASATGANPSDDDDDSEDARARRAALPVKPTSGNGGVGDDDDFMDLTRKLIEVRNILKAVKISGNLVLPSIVVIGSQSSGKSSVLEAIVGREFLPKGNNMVTRRPLELTLIHSPDLATEYAEFPQLGLGKVTNFRHVMQTLVDLNSAVPAADCVSDSPIELRIYSPNVPDLTLVDLPGYIQIHNKNQPRDLKDKIAALCEKYIQEPNVILAVCAADVDLANSDALRASRRVDPLGLRTIGVLTKIDLIQPDAAVNLLTANEYPLHLGYVGVVNRSGSAADKSLGAIAKRDPLAIVGVPALRTLLMRTLEERMGSRLTTLADAVDQELAEANYQFKVLYNDRRISAESYLAEAMDSIKHRFKDFTRAFGKPQVRSEVRSMLEDRIVEICEGVYWTDARLAELAKDAKAKDDPHWVHKLALASSALTKSGVGRTSTQLVVDSLMAHMEKLVAGEPFVHHPDTRRKVLQLANEIIRSKFHTTVDQVENTIKPYKFEVECTDMEWAEATKRAVGLLEREIANSQKAYDAIKATLGRRTLNGMISYLQGLETEYAKSLAASAAADVGALAPPSGASATAPTVSLAQNKPPEDTSRDPLLRLVPTDLDARPSGYTDSSLAKARAALYHSLRMQSLYSRLYHVKSRACRTPDAQTICPEVFLECVSEKLTYTAVMFIYIELLNEFFFQFPRDVDERLYYDLSKQQIGEFARENVGIRRQLDLAERKAVLDLAQGKLRALVRRQEEVARRKRMEQTGGGDRGRRSAADESLKV
ncbi:hypothetical protein BCR44DRAFT_55981 [Catenaria anguillulae PL171]|uniref:dynamin GTPase n=1 Tax=Catenaria anguillulae PL171 TaxID=765915 RepID=A0A1Y2HKJ1_9FUNG|nr:hypothetical protein BCR44DRAFT_55981 [Catenaria anguillulae PL171]